METHSEFIIDHSQERLRYFPVKFQPHICVSEGWRDSKTTLNLKSLPSFSCHHLGKGRFCEFFKESPTAEGVECQQNWNCSTDEKVSRTKSNSKMRAFLLTSWKYNLEFTWTLLKLTLRSHLRISINQSARNLYCELHMKSFIPACPRKHYEQSLRRYEKSLYLPKCKQPASGQIFSQLKTNKWNATYFSLAFLCQGLDDGPSTSQSQKRTEAGLSFSSLVVLTQRIERENCKFEKAGSHRTQNLWSLNQGGSINT
jgi:hypothetical protein